MPVKTPPGGIHGPRPLRGWMGVYAKGAAMGVAELIPGVSGGTIAFITGIYVELVESIRRVGPSLLGPLRRGAWREVWVQGNLGFIMVLGLGMATSVFGLAALVDWLLSNRPLELWGFFFGLIVASTWLVMGAVTPWTTTRGGLTALGVLLGVGIALMAPVAAPEGAIYIFLGGAIAVCAWILPGISGSYILLLMGLYPQIVAGVASRDLGLLAVLGAGCAVGLLSFSRGLSVLLQRAYRGTLALLAGVMAGSVLRLWPWRLESVGSLGDATVAGDAPTPALTLLGPDAFAVATGGDPRVVAVVLAAVGGTVMVLGLSWIAQTGMDPEGPGA